jgi:hypothetical protein
MDSAQNLNTSSYINIPLSQTFTSYIISYKNKYEVTRTQGYVMSFNIDLDRCHNRVQRSLFLLVDVFLRDMNDVYFDSVTSAFISGSMSALMKTLVYSDIFSLSQK